MKRSFGIAKKIWISLIILVLGYFTSTLIGFVLGSKTEFRLSGVSTAMFPASQFSQQALTAFNEQIKLYNDAVMLGDADTVETAGLKSQTAQEALQTIASLPGLSAGNKSTVEEVIRQVHTFTTSASGVYKAMSEGSDDEAAGEALGRQAMALAKQTEGLREKLTGLSKNFSESLKNELADIGQVTRQQRYFNMFLFFGIVVSLGVGVWFMIYRTISKPLNHAIDDLSRSSDQMSMSSNELSSASQSLADGSSSQAASIEETSSSLEEMASMTRQNADNAAEADRLMKVASQVVETANSTMSDLTHSMEEIAQASEETSKIIKTIDEIAFQTNLLALNAAVEAARAGEAGAGFAVVADEVRNLAMRAAEAAKNTSELIETTVKRIDDGSELVALTNDAFSQVSESSAKVGELVGEIAAASNEQAQGIEQINVAVSDMDQITQKNAANAEESAATSQEMRSQAKYLKNIVEDLIRLAGGQATSAHAVSEGTAFGSVNMDQKQISQSVDQKTRLAKLSTTSGDKNLTPEQVIALDAKDFEDF